MVKFLDKSVLLVSHQIFSWTCYAKQPFVIVSPLIHKLTIQNYQNKLDSFIHKTDNKDMDRGTITLKFWFQIGSEGGTKFGLAGRESLDLDVSFLSLGDVTICYLQRLTEKREQSSLWLVNISLVRNSYWSIISKAQLFSNLSRRNVEIRKCSVLTRDKMRADQHFHTNNSVNTFVGQIRISFNWGKRSIIDILNKLTVIKK